MPDIDEQQSQRDDTFIMGTDPPQEQSEAARLRAWLEHIAMRGNVHSSWLVADAKKALAGEKLWGGRIDLTRKPEPEAQVQHYCSIATCGAPGLGEWCKP